MLQTSKFGPFEKKVDILFGPRDRARGVPRRVWSRPRAGRRGAPAQKVAGGKKWLRRGRGGARAGAAFSPAGDFFGRRSAPAGARPAPDLPAGDSGPRNLLLFSYSVYPVGPGGGTHSYSVLPITYIYIYIYIYVYIYIPPLGDRREGKQTTNKTTIYIYIYI